MKQFVSFCPSMPLMKCCIQANVCNRLILKETFKTKTKKLVSEYEIVFTIFFIQNVDSESNFAEVIGEREGDSYLIELFKSF